MTTRGIRGAITVSADQPELILAATRELLTAMLNANPGLSPEALGSALFTVSEDLCSAFPAQAARQIGWEQVPMLCSREIPVPGSLPRVIRVLLSWNTERAQSEIVHVYLREAAALRPDLAATP